MGIKPVGHNAGRVRTARVNANTLVRKKDMTKGIKGEETDSTSDLISLSDQAKMGHKVGETTGMAGRKGSKTTSGKTDEDEKIRSDREEQLDLFTHSEETEEKPHVQEKTPQQLEQELKSASEKMGNAINSLPPEKQQVIADLNQKVYQKATEEEQRTGVPQNRGAMLAKEVIGNEQLQDQQGLQQAAGNFLNKDLAYNQGLLQQAAVGNPQAVAGDPQGFNRAMQNPGLDPLTAMGGGIPPGGGVPPGATPTPAPGSSHTDTAINQQRIQSDMQEARTIYTQMAAERQKWMMRMWQIMMDTQTKINEIIQSVALNRAKKSDEIAQKWIAVIQQ